MRSAGKHISRQILVSSYNINIIIIKNIYNNSNIDAEYNLTLLLSNIKTAICSGMLQEVTYVHAVHC